MIEKLRTRLQRWRTGYYGRLPAKIDHDVLITQASKYFGLPLLTVTNHFKDYLEFHEKHGYAQSLGERKTFSFEEAFLFYLLSYYLHPTRVVEIGVQYGRSTRRILDILDMLHLKSDVICFDIANELKFVKQNEVTLHIHDVTHDFTRTVLDELSPTLIYLDARPYPLLKNVISEFIEWSRTRPAALLIHDCSPYLFNPHMTVGREDYTAISSTTGVWERHALAEVFNTSNDQIDDLITPYHHLQIFETPHGLAVVTSLDALHKIEEK